MFGEIKFHNQQGLPPNDKQFINHPNPAISSVTVDLLTERDVLSAIWQRSGTWVEPEQMKLKELVPDTVLKFKSDKIKLMQKELRNAIKEAAGDIEKIDILASKYKVMTSLQKEISDRLGKRIVL